MGRGGGGGSLKLTKIKEPKFCLDIYVFRSAVM